LLKNEFFSNLLKHCLWAHYPAGLIPAIRMLKKSILDFFSSLRRVSYIGTNERSE